MAEPIIKSYTDKYGIMKFYIDSNPMELINDNSDIIDAAIDSKQDKLTATSPIILSGSNVSLNINSTNLKVSASKLDTIQNINTTATPQFAGIGVNGLPDGNYKIKVYGSGSITGDLVVDGNLTINGDTVVLNAYQLDVEDKNITLAKVSGSSPSDTYANGGGITLLGNTNKTITWDSTNANWNLSEHLNLASGKSYKLNNSTIIDSNRIGYLYRVELSSNGNMDNIRIGDDAYIGDGNVANHIVVRGNQDVNAGGIYFGSLKDTNLYRFAANTLKTDSNLWASKNIIQSKNNLYYSDGYTSGWGNTGFGLSTDVSGSSNFIVDNLTVRKNMNVYELLIRQIRATNGNQFVTAGAKVEVAGYLSNENTQKSYLQFEDATGHNLAPFKYNDILLVQKVELDSSATLKYVFARVNADTYTTGSWGDYFYSGSVKRDEAGRRYVVSYSVDGINWNYNQTIGSWFEQGDSVVRIGNFTDKNRQGSIYLASDDDNAPFIDIRDGVNSATAWNSNATKVRIGKLTGKTSDTFGSLKDYGFWSNNMYLEGNSQIAGTLTAGDSNGIGNTFYAGRIKKNLLTTDSSYPAVGSLSAITSSSVLVTDTPFSSNDYVRSISYSGYAGYVRASIPHSIGTPVKDKWYTVSMWIRNVDLGQLFVGFEPELGSSDSYARPDQRTGAYSNGSKVEIFSKWVRVSCSFRYTSITPSSNVNIYFYFSYGTGIAHITGVQVEEGENVSAYQKVDGNISSDNGYGMWAIKGGFGGTIQNPVINLDNAGLNVNANYSLIKQNVGVNGVYIGNYQSKTGFNGIILNQNGQTFYNNNSSIFNFDTVNASASIAGWTFDATKFSYSNNVANTGSLFNLKMADTYNRPILEMGWASGSVLPSTGQNYITLGGNTYTRQAVGQFTTTGWDTSATGGGLAINVSNKTLFFAGKRFGVEGAFIAGWNFDENKFYNNNARLESTSNLTGLAITSASKDVVKIGNMSNTDHPNTPVDYTSTYISDPGFNSTLTLYTGSLYTTTQGYWFTRGQITWHIKNNRLIASSSDLQPAAETWCTLKNPSNLNNKTVLVEYDIIVESNGTATETPWVNVDFVDPNGDMLKYNQYHHYTTNGTYHIAKYVTFGTGSYKVIRLQGGSSPDTKFISFDNFTIKEYPDIYTNISQEGLEIYKSPIEYLSLKNGQFDIAFPKLDIKGELSTDNNIVFGNYMIKDEGTTAGLYKRNSTGGWTRVSTL